MENTYYPDKVRQSYEKNAPAGRNYWCRFCSKWVKEAEFEVHQKEHQPKIKVVPIEE